MENGVGNFSYNQDKVLWVFGKRHIIKEKKNLVCLDILH